MSANEKLLIETSIYDLRRVFLNDISDPFIFVVNFTNQISTKNNNLINKDKRKDRSENRIVIKTTTNKARSISKKINEIFKVDPTINSFEINFPVKLLKSSQSSESNNVQIPTTKDKETIEETFNLLLLSTIKNCEIDKNLKSMLHHLKFFLGDELNENTEADQEDLTYNSYLIDNIKEAVSLLSTQYHYKSVEYLSENLIPFIQSPLMKGIDENILNDIIDLYVESHIQKLDILKSNKLFSIQNEIREIFKILQEKEENELLVYFLLSLKMENFNEEMLSYLINHIDDDIKSKEFSRLMFFIKQKLFPLFQNYISQQMIDLNQVHIDCHYKKGEELNGIISYLIQEGGREILSNGVLTLTGGTDPLLNPYHPITNVTEYGDKINDYFYNFHSTLTPSENSNFIDFDFGERQVLITSYTIRSNKNNENGRYHPKSWKICGSNDKTSWEVLDHQLDCPELNGPYKQHHFICEHVKSKYRYIRYVQEDSFDSARTRTNFKYIIYLTCIEFFGEIY